MLPKKMREKIKRKEELKNKQYLTLAEAWELKSLKYELDKKECEVEKNKKCL